MNQTRRGVACGMAAGALWGTVFMAPIWLPDFSPLQLSAGRYLAYGVFAMMFLLPRWKAVILIRPRSSGVTSTVSRAV